MKINLQEKNSNIIAVWFVSIFLVISGCRIHNAREGGANKEMLEEKMTQSDYSIGLWSMYQDRAAHELEIISGTKIPRGGMNSAFDLVKNLDLLKKQSVVLSNMKLSYISRDQALKNWIQIEVDAANVIKKFNHKKLVQIGDIQDYNQLIDLQSIELKELFKKREEIGQLMKKSGY